MPRGALPDCSHGLSLGTSPSWGAVFIVIFVCYAAMCSLLRFRRLDGLGYEDNHMRPVPEVQQLGRMLVDLLLSAYSRAMRPLGYRMLTVLMGERRRYVFGVAEPRIAVSALARRLVARYLLLPRDSPVRFISAPDARTGRTHHNHYLWEPRYVPRIIWSRWGPLAWFTRAFGGTVPGDGPEMKPEGFLFEAIGPRSKMGKGLRELARMEEQVRTTATGICVRAGQGTSYYRPDFSEFV